MRISEQFLSSLLARIDIVELIGKKISLRQVGSNFIGLCPFHQEKTPSFTVNKHKQFFHCFGCKEHGDAIRFIMLIEHKSFLIATQDLADRYGLCLEKENIKPEDPLTTEVHKILTLAVDYYHQNLLKNTPQATAALNYLITRKIDLNTIRYFKLGLAESSWTGLIDFCNSISIKNQLNPNLNLEVILHKAGLIIEKNNKFYDRFRNRIMFPICNKFNKTIGFGARSLNNQQAPKYLNSPETIVFSKAKELYGLSEIKNTLKNINNLLVVEGYIDFLTLFQEKICNVVATLGTSLNENHLQIMLSVTSEIIFCFDGDLAGFKASIRAMEITFKLLNLRIIQPKHSIKFMILPNEYDPDLLVREKGIQEFNKLLLTAKSLSDFFFDNLLKKYSDPTVENLNKLALEAKTYINKLPDQILQNLWYEKLAKILGIDSNLLKLSEKNINPTIELNKSTNKKFNNKFNVRTSNYPLPISNSIKTLAMLLINPNLFLLCNELKESNLIQMLKLPLPEDLDLLFKVIAVLSNNINVYTNDFRNCENIISKIIVDLEPVYAQKLLLIEPQKIVQFIPTNGMEQEFVGAVKQVKKILLELVVDELLMLSKQRELNVAEKLQLQQILQEL